MNYNKNRNHHPLSRNITMAGLNNVIHYIENKVLDHSRIRILQIKYLTINCKKRLLYT